jgi:radical SAM superfamily enzyme YgiQ (UPF0313 family)
MKNVFPGGENSRDRARGARSRILLSSVFGPYAQDDEYGSRAINPMELYHNQVTRTQGGFSLRMFHRSFGLMMIQVNIDAPCTLLDFPTLDRFVEEIRDHEYDVVGISSIIPNVGKAKKMCELVREHSPGTTIVVGGHVANAPGIDAVLDADHIVKGDGVRWFRTFLGQDPEAAVRHPLAHSGFGTRSLGITTRGKARNTAAILIPSVGCPVGCNFCSTSAMFGGKGKFLNFYETGDELFAVMCQIEDKLDSRSFFVLDENFLLHRERTLRLLKLMKEHEKSWSLYVFSSARVVKSYTMEQLVDLGVSWVWLGLEGEDSRYRKLRGIDTHALVRDLQSHGIRVLGSTIIGLEEHTSENMDDVISCAISHDTVFHQFMLYTPIPGTELYEQHRRDGTLLPESECPLPDIHGQLRFNYRHDHIRDGQEGRFLLRAFRRDFEVNGPSLVRMVRTTLKGWRRYKNHPEKRIRDRYAWEVRLIPGSYAGLVWAAKKWFLRQGLDAEKISSTLDEVHREFGLKSKLASFLMGPFIYRMLEKEQRRLANGWTYEPRTAYEKNAKAVEEQRTSRADSKSRTTEIRWAPGEPSTAARMK